jgi:hypothetical protein
VVARASRLFFIGGLAVMLVLPGAAAEARGWEEVHQTSDDVRVTVGQDGIATVQHHLRYRIVAGHFKALDFVGLEPSAELVAESTVLPEKGGEIEAHVVANPRTPGAVRITFDEPRGLARGVYVIDVKYRRRKDTTAHASSSICPLRRPSLASRRRSKPRPRWRPCVANPRSTSSSSSALTSLAAKP